MSTLTTRLLPLLLTIILLPLSTSSSQSLNNTSSSSLLLRPTTTSPTVVYLSLHLTSLSSSPAHTCSFTLRSRWVDPRLVGVFQRDTLFTGKNHAPLIWTPEFIASDNAAGVTESTRISPQQGEVSLSTRYSSVPLRCTETESVFTRSLTCDVTVIPGGHTTVDLHLQWEGLVSSRKSAEHSNVLIFGEWSLTSLDSSLTHSVFSLGVGEIPLVTLTLHLERTVGLSSVILTLTAPLSLAFISAYFTFFLTQRNTSSQMTSVATNCFLLLVTSIVNSSSSRRSVQEEEELSTLPIIVLVALFILQLVTVGVSLKRLLLSLDSEIRLPQIAK